MKVPLRVAIIGTSNSISGEGYVQTLKSIPEIMIVANASLGSSHSTLMPLRLENLSNIDFDVLIIDLSVNEQAAVYNGPDNLDLIPKVFLYSLLWCQSHRVMPLYLIMPEMIRSGASRNKIVRDLYVNLCTEYSIPYYDGYAFLEKLISETNEAEENLFSDPHHINRATSEKLGLNLARSMTIFMQLAEVVTTIAPVHNFSYTKLKSPQMIERATSLVQINFSVLSEGETVNLNLDADSTITAIALNMSQSNGSLCIEGTGKTFKRLDNAFYNPSHPLWLVVWSLAKPVFSSNGSFSLTAIRSEEASHFEINDHRRNGLPNLNDEIKLEIAGLISYAPQMETSLVTTSGANIDLAAI